MRNTPARQIAAKAFSENGLPVQDILRSSHAALSSWPIYEARKAAKYPSLPLSVRSCSISAAFVSPRSASKDTL
jgi:hypothetical protein